VFSTEYVANLIKSQVIYEKSHILLTDNINNISSTTKFELFFVPLINTDFFIGSLCLPPLLAFILFFLILLFLRCLFFFFPFYEHLGYFDECCFYVFWLFGTGLDPVYFYRTTKIFNLLSSHFSLFSEVRFIAYKQNLCFWGAVKLDLIVPIFNCLLKRLFICNVVGYNNCLGAYINWILPL
jgi:hypothetical protein